MKKNLIAICLAGCAAAVQTVAQDAPAAKSRIGFGGDIRATGDVLVDQLVQMARSGFSSAVLAPGVDAGAAARQFAHYGAFYQGDAQQPLPHFARPAAATAPEARP